MLNQTAENSETEPVSVSILVIPEYSQLTLAALVEPMRMANTVAGRPLYRWRLCSDGMREVSSSSGFTLNIDTDISELKESDVLFVISSYRVKKYFSRKIRSFLKLCAQRGAIIGGFDAAPFMLAESGVLDGYRATTHWDDLDDFRNQYRRITVVSERYVIDRKRITTSGSLPSLDLVLEFIRQQNGLMLAMNVSGNFLYDQARPGSEPQYMIATSLYNTRHPTIAKVIKLMEQSLHSPLPISSLANSAGVTERSLQRRFRAILKTSPQNYYRTLRLEAAKRMLGYSTLSITEVAVAHGFDSRASFTRAFKGIFGVSPSQYRARSCP